MGTKWTLAHIKRLKEDGKIRDYTIDEGPKTDQYKQLVEYNEPAALHFIKATLDNMGIEFVPEHRFSKKRRFRFDLAIVDLKIAIEYEGLYSEKSRHTTIEGFTMDAVKYNLAQSEGWKVLRYTASTYDQFVKDIKNLINT